MTGKNKMLNDFINNFVNKIQKTRDVSKERGNVLFLILIAVALFAALSYAVTSSSRSGGGDASSETNLVSSASITQYPASVRTTLIRMLIGGTTVDQLGFNPPPYTNLDVAANDAYAAVFHPLGGGAVYSPAGADVMTSANPTGQWFFNGNMEIPEVGIAGANGSDLIAFLPGISRGVCEKINIQLGITTKAAPTTPVLNANRAALYRTNMLDTDSDVDTAPSNFVNTDQADITDGSNGFDAQPFGCFRNASTGTNANEYVYYHVLIER